MQRVEKATVKGISTSPTPDSDPTYLTIEHLFKLATDGFIYLQSLGGFEGNPHKELQASMSVASLILRTIRNDIGFLSRQISDQGNEVRPYS